MRLASCSTVVVTIRYNDEPGCEVREKAACLAGEAAPGTGANPAGAESCAAAYRTNTSCDLLDNVPPPGCEVHAGSLTASTACAFPGQCQSAYCAVGATSVCGVCGTAPPGLGESCATRFCTAGLGCSATSRTCARFAARGQSCIDAPCTAGTVCVGPAGNKVCQTLVGAAGSGESCGLVNGARVGCALDGFCLIPLGQPIGTCVAGADDGTACNDVTGPYCKTPARCAGGTCKLPDGNCH
jgi:hypothetical protein